MTQLLCELVDAVCAESSVFIASADNKDFMHSASFIQSVILKGRLN